MLGLLFVGAVVLFCFGVFLSHQPAEGDKVLGVIVSVVATGTFAIVAAVTAASYEVNMVRAEAVKSGAAYWKVDDKSGTTTFTWKHLDKCEK